MANLLIFIAGLFISFFANLIDALTTDKTGIGWTASHSMRWCYRDIPLILIIITLLINGFHIRNILFATIIILIHSMHGQIIKNTKTIIYKFYGSPHPPEWWLKLRKLWGWWPGFTKIIKKTGKYNASN